MEAYYCIIAAIGQSGRICGKQSGNAEAYAFVFEYTMCIRTEVFFVQ